MKMFRRLLLVIVLLLVVAGVVVYLSIDHILKTTVESQATDSLNLKTTLNSAHLALMGGSVTLNNLQVASPQGYKAEHMLGLTKLNVMVNYSQLSKDPIHIAAINIDGPMLVIEQVGNKLNFQAMMDQQPKTAPPATPPSGGDRPKDQPIRVVIDQLTISNATVVVKPGLPGLDKEITVPIPSLTINNIGNGNGSSNGAAMKDVVMQVVTGLANEASKSGALTAALQDALKANVGQIAGKLTGQLQKQMGDMTGKLPGGIGNAATQKLNAPDIQKSIDKGLGGLLGGDKKK